MGCMTDWSMQTPPCWAARDVIPLLQSPFPLEVVSCVFPVATILFLRSPYCSLGSPGSDSPAPKPHSPQLPPCPVPGTNDKGSVTKRQLLFPRRVTDRSVPWPVGVQMSKLITLPGDRAVGKRPEIKLVTDFLLGQCGQGQSSQRNLASHQPLPAGRQRWP